MLTKKKIDQEFGGRLDLLHTDAYGTEFQLSLFTIGNIVTVIVCREEEIVYHNQKSYDNFKTAMLCYENTKREITNDESGLHKMFGAIKPISYIEIKKNVEDWIVKHKRPMNIADAQDLAKFYKDRSQALDKIYTAASAIAHDWRYATFRKNNNFDVQFAL